jgi:hypothetical protein
MDAPEKPVLYVGVSFLVEGGRKVCDLDTDRPCTCASPCPGVYPTREGEDVVIAQFRRFPALQVLAKRKREDVVEWLKLPAHMIALYYDPPPGKVPCPFEELRPCSCVDKCPGLYANIRSDKDLFDEFKKRPNLRFAREPFATARPDPGAAEVPPQERAIEWLKNCLAAKDAAPVQPAPAVVGEQETAKKSADKIRTSETSIMDHMCKFASTGNVDGCVLCVCVVCVCVYVCVCVCVCENEREVRVEVTLILTL